LSDKRLSLLKSELFFLPKAQRLAGRLGHASFQLEHLHRKLFASNDFVVVQLLSACLVDGEQDAWIHKSIHELIDIPESSLNSNQAALLQLMHLRRDLVDHLLCVLPSRGRNQLSCPEVCLAACLENGLYLCSTLPRLRKACHFVRKDAEVRMILPKACITEYFPLILCRFRHTPSGRCGWYA